MKQLDQPINQQDRTGERTRRSLLTNYALVATIAFVLFTAFAFRSPSLPGDVEMTRFIQSFRNPVLDQFMELVKYPGLYPQVIPLNTFVIVILYVFRCKWESITLLVTGPIIGIGGTLLRYGIDRPRPSPDLVWVAQEIERGHYGYPSGHALGFLAIFGFLWYLAFTLLKPSWHRTLLLIAYAALIALVGISRIYLGEHWASDVIAGYLAGSALLALTILFYRSARSVLYTRIARYLP